MFSQNKVLPEDLAMMYNMADVTINISDAEGFGLSALESLSCGTPVVATLTGGLQDQVKNGDKYYGVGLEPVSKAIIGSQDVPYIYEDRLSKDDFIAAMMEMYEMTQEERQTLSKECAEWAQTEFAFDKFVTSWDELFTRIYEEQGSWDTRTGYTPYEMRTF